MREKNLEKSILDIVEQQRRKILNNPNDPSWTEHLAEVSEKIRILFHPIPDPRLVELQKKLEEHRHPDPEVYCLKSRPQNRGMLGGPKYLCMMPKGHEENCFQVQQWSPDC